MKFAKPALYEPSNKVTTLHNTSVDLSILQDDYYCILYQSRYSIVMINDYTRVRNTRRLPLVARVA